MKASRPMKYSQGYGQPDVDSTITYTLDMAARLIYVTATRDSDGHTLDQQTLQATDGILSRLAHGGIFPRDLIANRNP
jgi:hypothetical protein